MKTRRWLFAFLAATTAALGQVTISPTEIDPRTGTGSAVLNTSPTLVTPNLTGYKLGVASKTASYTLTSTDGFVVFSGTTAAQSLTLPAVSGTTGTVYIIKNRATTSVNVVTTAAANELFTYAAVNSITLATGDSVMVISDGTYWTIN